LRGEVKKVGNNWAGARVQNEAHRWQPTSLAAAGRYRDIYKDNAFAEDVERHLVFCILSSLFASRCHTSLMSSDQKIEIYTDGACSPNPGRGGYGVIIVQNALRRELSGGFAKTTNNRMEILAAIEGLKGVTGEQGAGLDITVFSDSRYLVDMFNQGHAKRWRAKGWLRGPKDRAKNEDLWGCLLDLTALHGVKFVWVKSHNEHPENERCDQLAVEARQQVNLPVDEKYERGCALSSGQCAVGSRQNLEEQLVLL